MLCLCSVPYNGQFNKMDEMTVYIIPRESLCQVGECWGIWCDGPLCGVLSEEDLSPLASSRGQVWGWKDPIPSCAELFGCPAPSPGPLLRSYDAAGFLSLCEASGFRWGVWEPIESAILWGFPASIEFYD